MYKMTPSIEKYNVDIDPDVRVTPLFVFLYCHGCIFKKINAIYLMEWKKVLELRTFI